ncbi:hypothetical protein [Neptunicella marina]|uniref:Uncharacterized protein n=1 Tax=Neptunicella marina TaxID=2125989 RepID=A0A8J6ISX0_9ALTE|nr:hypothetical protein [Neptunicella marina]MBC3765018.1 hypothetical protein [Neptunicella marina]
MPSDSWFKRFCLFFFGERFFFKLACNSIRNQRVVIYGAGELGQYALDLLKTHNQIVCLAQTAATEKQFIAQVPVLGIDSVFEHCQWDVLLIASVKFEQQMLDIVKGKNCDGRYKLITFNSIWRSL